MKQTEYTWPHTGDSQKLASPLPFMHVNTLPDSTKGAGRASLPCAHPRVSCFLSLISWAVTLSPKAHKRCFCGRNAAADIYPVASVPTVSTQWLSVPTESLRIPSASVGAGLGAVSFVGDRPGSFHFRRHPLVCPWLLLVGCKHVVSFLEGMLKAESDCRLSRQSIWVLL